MTVLFGSVSRHRLDRFCEQQPLALREDPRRFESVREEDLNGTVRCGVVARYRPASRRRGHSLPSPAVNDQASAASA